MRHIRYLRNGGQSDRHTNVIYRSANAIRNVIVRVSSTIGAKDNESIIKSDPKYDKRKKL